MKLLAFSDLHRDMAAADELVPADRRPAGRLACDSRWLARHDRSYLRPVKRNASMNGSMSPSMTASTLPISTFVRWSLISW